MQPKSSELEYKDKNGTIFYIRSEATRRDQSQMNIALSDGAGIEDGKIMRVSPLKIYPWLVERFLTRWSGGSQTTGRDILNALYDQPADPEEDLVMVIGSYIFNHVRGLNPSPENEHKKKG